MRRHTSRLMKRIPKGRKGERSITGLQAAIVLIAFVVVSSMLAFATIPTRGDSQDITRAETAIVLVAFVALSLVFSVAFHSAGLFSSDKSRRTMKTGLAETGDIPEAKRGYVNRCVNDIRRRPSQPLIQWRFHPHTVHRDRRLRSTQGPSDA